MTHYHTMSVTWEQVWDRCERSYSVESYDDREQSIKWAGEDEWQDFDDPQAAWIAISEMEAGNGDPDTTLSE